MTLTLTLELLDELDSTLLPARLELLDALELEDVLELLIMAGGMTAPESLLPGGGLEVLP